MPCRGRACPARGLDVYKRQVQTTLYKVRSTMCNCGALSIPELQEKARLTVVSSTSIVAVSYTHLDVYKRQDGWG